MRAGFPSRLLASTCWEINTNLMAVVEVTNLINWLFQMLMPKKNRIAIYELLFKEGVMVAKKDVHLAKHPELADKNVPNLHVMKAMQVRLSEMVLWLLTCCGCEQSCAYIWHTTTDMKLRLLKVLCCIQGKNSGLHSRWLQLTMPSLAVLSQACMIWIHLN